jgi:gas vesicle protein
MSKGNTPDGKSLLWAALAGGVLGGLVGILAAPAPGEETRNRISRRLGESADSLLQKSQEAMEQAWRYSRRAAS